ncbi:MAG: F0F1 ATP synthase subunit B [Anaerolineales bacterium]|nr:F0F1 ATP synthase subunit B [Anaerolineales bacterium]
MEALGLTLGYLLVQLFSFLILVLILHAWAYKPIVGMLQKRRKTIAQAVEDARIAADARENAEKDAEELLAKAQQEAAERIRDSKQQAEEVALQIKEHAEKEATEIRAAAQESAHQIKVDALKDLRGEVASLAIAAAQQLISSSMDEERQRALVVSFFSGLKDRKIVLLEGDIAAAGDVHITSALPLSEEEQKLIQADLKSRLNIEPVISFDVDPSILGGLVIQIGDKVIDGSVVGKLQNLRASL